MKINPILILTLLTLVAGCASGPVKRYETVTPAPGGGTLTNVVYAVTPGASNVVETIRTVIDATGPVNPYAVPLNLALGAAVSLLGWYAKKKTDAANSSDQQLRTIVLGVENAARTAGPDSPQAIGVATVKESISALAGVAGIHPALDRKVQNIVAGVPPAP